MFLSNKEIIKYTNTFSMVTPFIDKSVSTNNGKKIMSYGLSQNAYDVRLDKGAKSITGHTFFGNDIEATIDKIPDEHLWVDDNGRKYYIVQPKGFLLAKTMETFNIPNDITGFLYCKSTYARYGMNMAPTTLKTGWSGKLILEIFNQSPYFLKVYVGEGIGSIYFAKHSVSLEDEETYQGRYNEQSGNEIFPN